MVAVWAIAAVLGFSLLPALHVHLAGSEGRAHSTVHRHSLDDAGSGPAGTSIASHGDHERALFLSTSYDSISRFVPHAPAVVDAATAVLPSPGPLESIRPDDARSAHGPPGSTDHSRAPPVEI